MSAEKDLSTKRLAGADLTGGGGKRELAF